MQPVAVSLDRLQGKKDCGQGYIFPTLNSMKHRMASNEGTGIMKDYEDVMMKVITKRFKNYFEINNRNRDLVVATVSEPRFKTTFIEREYDRNIARLMLLKECFELNGEPQTEDDQNSVPNENNLDDDFYVSFSGASIDKRISTDQNVELEVSRYIGDHRKDKSILIEYPNVKNVFLKFNTTLPASAAIERVFSQSSLIFTPRRNRIPPENFERTLLLKHNKF